MNWIKKSTLVVLAACSTMAVFAQDSKAKSKKIEKNEEIIIRKKGDSNEKTTIVIDGDQVTVNGKPMEDYKGKEITILKRPGGMMFRQGGPMALSQPNIQGFGDMMPAMAGNKALLGVTTEKVEGGVKINSVSDESGAEKAGLKKDDIITKVGDKSIATPDDLVEAIGKYKPEDKVDIAYKRDGKSEKTTATLGKNKARAYAFNMDGQNFNFEMPDRAMAPSLNGSLFNWNRKPKIGMQIQDVQEGKGVTVKEIDDDSPAQKSGFKEGDIITAIDGKQIEGVDDLVQGLKGIKDGDSIKIEYKRDGKMQTGEIKIPKKLKTADL